MNEIAEWLNENALCPHENAEWLNEIGLCSHEIGLCSHEIAERSHGVRDRARGLALSLHKGRNGSCERSSRRKPGDREVVLPREPHRRSTDRPCPRAETRGAT